MGTYALRNPGVRRRIHLPAAPGNGIAAVHQETVAGVTRGEGIAAFVKPQDRVPAAIDKIVDQPAIPFFRVHRLEDHEVHAVLDVAFGIERSAVHVDDARVAGRARIEFAVGCSGKNFIRSGAAERSAAKGDLAFRDDQPGDSQTGGRGALLRDCRSAQAECKSHSQNAN